jgi:hypothetical protein
LAKSIAKSEEKPFMVTVGGIYIENPRDTKEEVYQFEERCWKKKKKKKKIPLFFNIKNIVFFQRKFFHQKKILLLVLSVGESFLTKERFSDVWKREKGKILKVA